MNSDGHMALSHLCTVLFRICLMLLMESKQEGLIPLVHLIMFEALALGSHCYVWMRCLLVLGYINCSFLLCYLGTVCNSSIYLFSRQWNIYSKNPQSRNGFYFIK